MPNKLIKVDIAVNAPLESVWKWLFSPENLRRLVDFPIRADLHATDPGCYAGTVSLDGIPYDTNVKPHDITFSSHGYLLGIRLTKAGSGCRVFLASSTPDGRHVRYTESCMRSTLQRLKSFVEPEPIRPFSYDTSSKPAQEVPDRLSDFSAYPNPPRAHLNAPSPISYGSDSSRKNGFFGRLLRTVLTLVLCLGVIVAGVLYLPQLAQQLPSPSASVRLPSDVSANVTMDLALTITPGTTQDEISELFDTAGLKQDSSRIYRSDKVNGSSLPLVQVKIDYENGVARHITCLDLSASSVVGALTSSSIPAAFGDTLEAMETAAGTPVSMVRRYIVEGGEVQEYHFGYLDPFANFSPEWRGEIVVTMNSVDSSCHVRNWIGYDGSDPLMIDSLEGEAVSYQYDNYDEFLHDKYQFDYSLLLLGRYSQGDLRALFGDFTSYDGGGGFSFHHLDSTEHIMLPDGTEAPLWRMSFGLNTKGQFMVGSYLNTRLAAREGSLSGCRPSAVAPGMTYSEVREYLPIIPTALYVTEGSYMLCYGTQSEKTTTEDQFEFVVSFGYDNRVNAVHDNRGMNAQGSISTNDPEANTAG